MSDQNEQTLEPEDVEQETPGHSSGSLVVSLAFWITLLAAGVLYAAVTLSPGIIEWYSARDQYATNARRLLELEHEVDHLDRLVEAMRKDPEFARRMTEQISRRVPEGIGRTRPGRSDEASASVAGSPLKGGSTASLSKDALAKIEILASDRQVRRWILVATACLTLLAFTILNESGNEILTAVFGSVWRMLTGTVRRYRRTAEESGEG